jgi:hypothetical protein
MKEKIVGILVATLLIATAVLPVVGTMNENMGIATLNIQQPTVEWKKTYGGDEFDHFHTVRQTDDGGYIACGNTEENDMYYVWLVKVDSAGNEEWSVVNHDLNGSFLTDTEFWIMGFDVSQTSDGGYIVCGVSMQHDEYQGEEGWLPTGFFWKTDDNGNTEWLEHYYNFEEEPIIYFIYSGIEVEDGFVGGGFGLHWDSTQWVVIDQNGLIIKTDSSGNLEWVNEFDKGGSDSLSSVSQTSDGGYFLSGFVSSASVNQGALWMVKTDGDGTMQWDSLFDGPGFEYTYGKGSYQTSDGGYIMNGVSNSYGHGGTDIWVIKTDSAGNLDWDAAYGGTKNDYCWGMCNADNQGCALGICTDYQASASDRNDILIIETDKDGNAEWKLRILEEGSEITRSISQTEDGGYIASAMTSKFGYPTGDGVLVKVASFDNERPVKPSITGPSNGKPEKEYTFTASSSDPDGNSLQYMWDWGDGEYSDWLDSTEATYSWTAEDNFEIRVMAMDEHGGESEWSDPFVLRFLENHLHMFPLLRRLLDL